MSPEKRLLYGYTDAEAAEILKKESPEHKAQQEREGREQGGLRWDRFKRKVRREQQREAVQRAADAETIAKMTPAQYDEFRRKRDSTPARPSATPPSWVMAAEDNRREDEQAANRAREAAEQKAGIPKLERASAARMEKIRDGANAELAELDERRHAVQARRRRKEAEEEQRRAAEVAATRESLRVPA